MNFKANIFLKPTPAILPAMHEVNQCP